jgi:hypothetical protein
MGSGGEGEDGRDACEYDCHANGDHIHVLELAEQLLLLWTGEERAMAWICSPLQGVAW